LGRMSGRESTTWKLRIESGGQEASGSLGRKGKEKRIPYNLINLCKPIIISGGA
jgi:hypothetical protein